MFPYKITPVDPDVNKQLLEDFKGAEGGFCQVGPQKWLLPSSYAKHAEGYYTMPLKKDDVWIITYPRSGTTLCQELVWLINNNFDYETASAKSLECRVPFYEFELLHSDKVHKEMLRLNNNNPNTIEQIQIWKEPGFIYGAQMESPRYFKTHLPYSLLPPDLDKTCKSVYVARNPKDVAVSYFHLNKFIMLHDFVAEFDKYWDYFERDLLLWSPYWEHIKEGWQRRNNPNVLFLFYEDIIKNMPSEILKINDFFNKSITFQQMEELIHHLEINNFRQKVKRHKHIEYVDGFFNTREQGFIRKGKVGINEEYNEVITQRADKWIKEHLADTDLKFPFTPV